MQDWTPLTIQKQGKVNDAKRSIGSKPVNTAPEVRAAAKLANTEIGKPKILADRQEIVTRRLANSWSQADLNIQCRFPINTIRDIESGKICPTIQQLNMLNRVLKCGLKYA